MSQKQNKHFNNNRDSSPILQYLNQISTPIWQIRFALLGIVLLLVACQLVNRVQTVTSSSEAVAEEAQPEAGVSQPETSEPQPMTNEPQPETGEPQSMAAPPQPETGERQPEAAQAQPVPEGAIEGAILYPDPGRNHQEGDIAYSQDAPVGGLHNPQWLNCGIYEEPVRVENVVHSMEHGAVWIAYQPDLPADQVELLQALVRQDQAASQGRWIILAPLPGLKDPVVATAWRVQLRLNNAADERLAQFVQQYRQSPYHPEPGANCMFGGIGEPRS